MPIPLRHNTATQAIPLGPFIGEDGLTPAESLTITPADVQIWKNAALTEVPMDVGGTNATHMGSGRYVLILEAADVDVVGPMEINIHMTGALPVKKECIVYPAAIYDALFEGSRYLPVEIVEDSTSMVEMAQGEPPSAVSFTDAINYLYRAWRNPKETDSIEHRVLDENGVATLFKKTIADDGTTFTESKQETGV